MRLMLANISAPYRNVAFASGANIKLGDGVVMVATQSLEMVVAAPVVVKGNAVAAEVLVNIRLVLAVLVAVLMVVVVTAVRVEAELIEINLVGVVVTTVTVALVTFAVVLLGKAVVRIFVVLKVAVIFQSWYCFSRGTCNRCITCV